MKKNIIRYAAAAIASIAAIACSKNEPANPGTPENPDTKAPFTITAAIDDAPDTRYAATDDGSSKIELTWKDLSDQIDVVNSDTGGTSYQFSLASILQDGKTAVFQAPSDYPADAVPAYAIQQNQTSFGGTLDPKNIAGYILYYTDNAENLTRIFPLCGRYDPASRKLMFKPLYAVLKLNITLPEGASGRVWMVYISSKDGSKVFYNNYSNKYDITKTPFARSSNTLYPTFQLSNASYGNYTLSAERKITLYCPIDPGEELVGKELELLVWAGDASYTTPITGAILEAGKCYPLTLPASKWTAGQ